MVKNNTGCKLSVTGNRDKLIQEFYFKRQYPNSRLYSALKPFHRMILAVETHRHKSIGTLLRCASAFGASCIVVVGSPQYSTHGAHGAQNHIEVVHFYYWQDCIEFCRKRNCDICSISPVKICAGTSDVIAGTVSVDNFTFSNVASCFIVGERDGLTAEQLSISDVVFHVEVPCMDFEDKVVYDSKVAICLQKYAATAGLMPRSHENEKHVLGDRDCRRAKTVKVGRDNARVIDSKDAIDGTEGEEVLSLLFG